MTSCMFVSLTSSERTNTGSSGNVDKNIMYTRGQHKTVFCDINIKWSFKVAHLVISYHLAVPTLGEKSFCFVLIHSSSCMNILLFHAFQHLLAFKYQTFVLKSTLKALNSIMVLQMTDVSTGSRCVLYVCWVCNHNKTCWQDILLPEHLEQM